MISVFAPLGLEFRMKFLTSAGKWVVIRAQKLPQNLVDPVLLADGAQTWSSGNQR